MCGYLGKISKDAFHTDNFDEANKANICRGPDAIKKIDGQFLEIEGLNIKEFYCLIFNRLSIIDLSDKAMQPMYSSDFKSMIMFNGEIYNHRELRIELEKKGIKFKTYHSDTEVLLNGLSYYGPSFINKVIGQFSIVFLDLNKKILYLIRDRVGQKPLYYSKHDRELAFSTNLKSLLKIKNEVKIDEKEITNFINFGVIPSPNTIFKDTYKVKPGHIVEVDFSDDKFKYKQVSYWQIENFIDTKKFNSEKFFSIFQDSVQKRLESDVPVANFASGGIDSTAIIKAMHDIGCTDLNTFSIISDDLKYDESLWSNQVAQRYDTDHKQSRISATVSIEDILNSIDIFDEPYSDPSTVPSYLLNKAISSSYKVAISGDGGDELLGGYLRLSNVLAKKNILDIGLSKLFTPYPGFLGTGNKFLSRSKNLNTAYSSYFEDLKLLKMLKLAPQKSFADEYMNNTDNSYKELLISDYKFYLYEMMTHKIDRTSMANSIEIRSPFLDHRLIEYIISSDNSYVDSKNPKRILKEYIATDFTDEFINREKKGFVFNLEGWVYNNLDIIENTFKEGTYVKSLNPNITKLLSVNKSRINGHRIWKLFFLERYLSKVYM